MLGNTLNWHCNNVMLGNTLSGRYQIIKHLGSGGFGQTFLAKDTQLPDNPLCVVKQLKPKSNDPDTLQTARHLFEREAQALYQLGNHSQIPLLMADFEENEQFYLVQEFIEGREIKQELPVGKPLSQTQVIALCRDVLEILEFVHEQGVIHRDIKPSNLIRRKQDGKIVLIDFGAVKQVSAQIIDREKQTTFTVAIGSPVICRMNNSVANPDSVVISMPWECLVFKPSQGYLLTNCQKTPEPVKLFGAIA
jgi:serine/threonine protein kinase